jgi:hypothetical protein
MGKDGISGKAFADVNDRELMMVAAQRNDLLQSISKVHRV